MAAVAAAMAAFAEPTDHASAAGTAAFTEHASIDVIGAVFQCGETALTVSGGTIQQTAHFSPDATGALHFSIALATRGMTAVDDAGTSYTITGASHVAGAFTGDQLDLVTDSSHFVIRDGTGVAGRVSLVDHYNLRAHSFTLVTGNCSEARPGRPRAHRARNPRRRRTPRADRTPARAVLGVRGHSVAPAVPGRGPLHCAERRGRRRRPALGHRPVLRVTGAGQLPELSSLPALVRPAKTVRRNGSPSLSDTLRAISSRCSIAASTRASISGVVQRYRSPTSLPRCSSSPSTSSLGHSRDVPEMSPILSAANHKLASRRCP